MQQSGLIETLQGTPPRKPQLQRMKTLFNDIGSQLRPSCHGRVNHLRVIPDAHQGYLTPATESRHARHNRPSPSAHARLMGLRSLTSRISYRPTANTAMERGR
jgi:hypothetical protein